MPASPQSILDLLKEHPGGLTVRRAAGLLAVNSKDYRSFRRLILELTQAGTIAKIKLRYHHPDIAPASLQGRGGSAHAHKGRGWPGYPRRVEKVELQSVETERAEGMQNLLAEFGLSPDFTQAQLAESRRVAALDPLSGPGRVDYTEIPLLTIDPEDARDHDDAIWLELLPGGIRRLGVHIADVAAFVVEGEPLDREAFARGCSTYFFRDTIPMLPPLLSGEICSLREGENRAAVSVTMDFDAAGALRETRYAESIVRIHEGLSYEKAEELLDDESSALGAKLREMQTLADTLRLGRAEQGALQFELPETVPADGGEGVEGFVSAPLLRSNRIVEEFMLAANRAVGFLLREKGVPHLYRVHEPPAQEGVEELSEHLSGRSVHWSPAARPDSRAFQSLAASLSRRPDSDRLLMRMLRAMSKAEYAVKDAGHFGLAWTDYVHFTSPIRRYADLHTHRLVKELIAGELGGLRGGPRLLLRKGGAPDPAVRARKDRSDYGYLFDERGGKRRGLGELAAAINERELVSLKAERESLKLEMTLWARRHMGEEFAAKIVEVMPTGLLIRLTDVGLESYLPAGLLGREYFVYDEMRAELRGERSGRSFGLDRELQVRIAGANLFTRRIQFLLEEDSNSYDTGRQRKPRRGP